MPNANWETSGQGCPTRRSTHVNEQATPQALSYDGEPSLFVSNALRSVLTGWMHHVVYIGITETAIRRGWARVFCLPPFLLSLSTLFPRTRSNTLFALTFIATRIVFQCWFGSFVLGVGAGVRFSLDILACRYPGFASYLDGDGRYARGSARAYGRGWTACIEVESGAQCARRRLFLSLHSMTRLGGAALSRPCERLCAGGVYALLQREPWGDWAQGGEHGTRGGAAPTRLMLSRGGHGPRASSQCLGSGQAAVVTRRLRFLRSQLCERLRAACRRALLQSAAWSREQSGVGNAERGGEHPQSREDKDGVVPLLWTAPGRGQGRAVSSASAIIESGPRQSRSASSAYPIGGFLFGFRPSFLFSLLYIYTLRVHLYSPHPHGTITLLPTALLALVSPLHAMWFRGCVKGFVRWWRLRQAEVKASTVEVRAEGEKVGVEGEEVEGEVVSASGAKTILGPDTSASRAVSVGSSALSNAHAHAQPGQWGVTFRLRRVSRALLERGVAVAVTGSESLRWWSYSWIVGSPSPSPTPRWRWRTALLERVKHRRLIRPRATMMARRVSAGLIAVLPQIAIPALPTIPTMPSREVLGYVRGLG
ncbi:hypothetical protein B0H13DRAFT_2668990 [Mycena leptocephala]|nr:hypothetical protein B0H13DRAFT_2668990 [Mycena leptocephala]